MISDIRSEATPQTLLLKYFCFFLPNITAPTVALQGFTAGAGFLGGGNLYGFPETHKKNKTQNICIYFPVSNILTLT